jgi:RNA polymerase sigma factor (sigma-70 family)
VSHAEGGLAEAWRAALAERDPDAAWEAFLDEYRGLIFAVIRHYTREHDEVMDVFADVCEALREDRLARLRRYWDHPTHRARFSSWLATVVRNLTIDWLRQRMGRRRSRLWADLSPLQERIVEHVFEQRRSHVEAYELIRSTFDGTLSFGAYVREVAATYRAVDARRGSSVAAELGGPAPALDADATDDDVMDPAVISDTARTLGRALESLASDERLAVELFVVNEMPAAEVARIVRWPNAKAVYNRVYRALAAIRATLEQRGIRREDL